MRGEGFPLATNSGAAPRGLDMAKSFCSAIIVDADYGATGWEIVYRFDPEDNEGAWSDLTDEELPEVVGAAMAELLIAERDSQK